MKRRKFLSALGVSTLGFSLGGTWFSCAKSKRPNFLFLFTDDQTFNSIECLNNPAVKTPNINRLVKKGITFTHCFNQGSWTGAVCVASRAMLNTGQYIYHAQKNINSAPLWGETFGKAGYDTFVTGKWHNGEETLKKSFKYIGETAGGMLHSTPMPNAENYAEEINNPKGAYNRPRLGNSWTPYDHSLKGHWLEREGEIVHSSENWANQAINFLENRSANSKNPFFMYVAFHAPHDPRQSPKEFVDMYPLDEIEIPPNYLPEHPFDQGDHRLRDELLAPFPRTEYAVKVHLQEYYAIISHADYQIGRILDALEASGDAENTYIIFSADHGLAVGQHGLMGKQNQYDHSIRMPLIYCGPGIAQDKKNDSLVYLQSAFATTCELAGLEIPPSVEFPSLRPLLFGETQELHQNIFGSYRDFQRMIRSKDFKLIRYPHIKKTQLFDLQRDPWEKNNLAENPLYSSTINELNIELKKLQKEVGDTLELD
jgi:arylsulfatase A-like enzyme